MKSQTQYERGFMVHALRPCGHSVGDFRDPGYIPGQPNTYTGSESCVGCEREARWWKEFHATSAPAHAAEQPKLTEATQEFATEFLAFAKYAFGDIRSAWPMTVYHLAEMADALLTSPVAPSPQIQKEEIMKGADLMQTTDHVIWAKEFVQRYGGDEELMASWFASAMMAMHDKLHGPPNGDAMQYQLDQNTPPAPPVQEPHTILNKDHFPALCPACTPPVQERESDEPAPPNSLPTWQECQRLIQNHEFRERAKAGLEAAPVEEIGPEPIEPTEIHRFIYEYDCADRYKSTWFMHRLELALTTAAKQAEAATLLECSRAIGKPDDYFAGKEVRDCVAAIRKQAREGALEEAGGLAEEHGDMWLAKELYRRAVQPEQQKEEK